MSLIIFIALIAMATADGNAVLKESNDQFTASMFGEVVKSMPDKSVIMSAFSVLTPLAQLALASVGETHDEVLRAIHLPNDNVTKEAFKGVYTQLRNIKGVDLKMASRVYIAQDAELNPSFGATSRDLFNSDVKNVNFQESVNTAQEINTWVENQTNNKIKDLVDPQSLTALTRAVLVNAIYFKGSWKTKFDKAKTVDGDFHVTKDKTVKVPFMHKTATYLYGESSDLDAKVLEMPYEGDECSFVIVLPNKVDGLAALEEKLKDPSTLAKASKNLNSVEVKVTIPKFKIETKINLKDVLQKLQVKQLFEPGKARLDNLLTKESDLYVSEAVQKAFIELNEEGAEAAAANAFVGFGSAYVDPSKIVNFNADTPFYFQIKTDLTLFEGVYQP